MIISSVAGAALQSLKLGATIKQAIDSPRLHNQLEPNCTQYEKSFPVVSIISNNLARNMMVWQSYKSRKALFLMKYSLNLIISKLSIT